MRHFLTLCIPCFALACLSGCVIEKKADEETSERPLIDIDYHAESPVDDEAGPFEKAGARMDKGAKKLDAALEKGAGELGEAMQRAGQELQEKSEEAQRRRDQPVP